MSYAWEVILKDVAKALSLAAGIKIQPDELAPPPDKKLGDLAFGCFRLAKIHARSPIDIAKEIVGAWKRSKYVAEVSATGPYVNVSLKSDAVAAKIIGDIESMKGEYGLSKQGGGKQVMVEYAQPNTHKEIHVGHLRNILIGSVLARILKANGWKVVTASYHGDIGAHVAKCLWFMVRKFNKECLADLSAKDVTQLLKSISKDDRTGKYLGSLYTGATKLVDDQPDLKTEVSSVQQKLEAKDLAWTKLWEETRKWSLVEMKNVFEELGADITRQYLESEVVDEGQGIVDSLLKKQVAKISQGAVVVDLENQKLGIFLIRKSDGTSLYATKDLALAFLKMREYPKLARSMMVVDNRQSLYFKQLFVTLKSMGVRVPMEFVGHEFVTLKSGAMSSREGNIVTWQELRDESMSYAMSETKKRHLDWSEKKIAETAWALVIGGLNFGMLKQDSEKIIVFDQEKSLSYDGDTGPYVQYAVTRLKSILKKAKWKRKTGAKPEELSNLTHDTEKRLALVLAAFPQVIVRAGNDLRPSPIAEWCLSAATAANAFYRDVSVLDSEPALKAARLRLIASNCLVLEQALSILGITVPDEM
jgi:arginyl-tRNA synthetase